MPNSPYSNDPTHVQSNDPLLQGDRMPEIPRRAPALPPPTAASPEEDSAETRHEEALTVRYAIGKLSDFIQWFIAVLEIMLAIRFLLKLIGADPANPFASFLYALTNIILVPFSNIVQPAVIRAPNQSFEWSTLIAMGIYALIFWAVGRFLRILISSPEEPAA